MKELNHIQLIPINKINILNPRVRSRKQHLEIVESIKHAGLKKPISVRLRSDHSNGFEYDLICGQGRLEAFKILKQEEIWACILEVSEEESLIMSLVENIARHNRSSLEQMQEIQALRQRAYSSKQIAERIGTTESWVGMVISLLDRGESRLLAAVDNGTIPISLAIEIARGSTTEIQDLLVEALEKKEIKANKITAIRNILEKRERLSKAQSQNNVYGRNTIKPRKMSPESLHKIFEEEIAEQELLGKQANLFQEKLIFIQHSFKQLGSNQEFENLLLKHGLLKMPLPLQTLIDQGLIYND